MKVKFEEISELMETLKNCQRVAREQMCKNCPLYYCCETANEKTFVLPAIIEGLLYE